MANKYEIEVDEVYRTVSGALKELVDDSRKLKEGVTNATYDIYSAFKKGLAKLLRKDDFEDTPFLRDIMQLVFPGYLGVNKDIITKGPATIDKVVDEIISGEKGFLGQKIAESKAGDSKSGLEKAIKEAAEA